MGIFSNTATLEYNGNVKNSNVVFGEIRMVLSAEKTAVSGEYTVGQTVTYVISIVNDGDNDFENLTITDNLGASQWEGEQIYPLTFRPGSILYYVNGELQDTPTVEQEQPLEVTGIDVPANGNAMVIYEATVNNYAPVEECSKIVNRAEISGNGISNPIEVRETVNSASGAVLDIFKALCPEVVTENGELTYTFTIQNSGNRDAGREDGVILTDTFDPILRDIEVTINRNPADNEDYTYNEQTGEFATTAGAITVPEARYRRNEDGTYAVKPGVTVVTVTGTV